MTAHRPADPVKQLTYAQLNRQADGYMQQTIALAGPGPWKKLDNKTVWKPGGLFAVQSCESSASASDAQSVTMSVNGPPSAHPEADAKRVADGWAAHGYTVSTVVGPIHTNDGTSVEIRADLPNGAILGYTATSGITGIDVQSECSTDPTLTQAAQ